MKQVKNGDEIATTKEEDMFQKIREFTDLPTDYNEYLHYGGIALTFAVISLTIVVIYLVFKTSRLSALLLTMPIHAHAQSPRTINPEYRHLIIPTFPSPTRTQASEIPFRAETREPRIPTVLIFGSVSTTTTGTAKTPDEGIIMMIQVKKFEILLTILVLIMIALKIGSIARKRKLSAQNDGSAIALKVCNTQQEQMVLWKKLNDEPSNYKLVCRSPCTKVQINRKLFGSAMTFHWDASLQDMTTDSVITLPNRIEQPWLKARKLGKIVGKDRFYLIHAMFEHKGTYIQVQTSIEPKNTEAETQATAPYSTPSLYGTLSHLTAEARV